MSKNVQINIIATYTIRVARNNLYTLVNSLQNAVILLIIVLIRKEGITHAESSHCD